MKDEDEADRRDEEIRHIMQVLSRRTKNNPVLIGEPGVGKTAIVEGLARRIVSIVSRIRIRATTVRRELRQARGGTPAARGGNSGRRVAGTPAGAWRELRQRVAGTPAGAWRATRVAG